MKNNSRRDFIKKTLGTSLGAAGVVAGGGLLSACNRVESIEGDTIKLLTAGGQLVEVEAQNLSRRKCLPFLKTSYAAEKVYREEAG